MLNMDKSLDDLIQANKQSAGRRAQNSGGHRPPRRFQNRTDNRAVPYQVQSLDRNGKNDMFANHAATYPAQTVCRSCMLTGTKLIVSNLDDEVSDEDIKELFCDVGEVQRYSMNYDKSGRSKGTAEVVYSLRRDAEKAVMTYHDVLLDGKRMKVETVGKNLTIPVASKPPFPINNMYDNQYYPPPISSHGGRASGFRRHRNRGRGGRLSRGGGGGYEKVPSAEDMDADLDNYHAEAAAARKGKPRSEE